MLLQLKRFIFCEQPIQTVENQEPNTLQQSNPAIGYISKKNNTTVAIPASLTLEPFMKKSAPLNEPRSYQLKSIVHHIGRLASSGHYTAQAKRGNEWVDFDDSKTA